MMFSKDAPALENALHKKFHHYRLNKVNERKEFFRVDLADIEKVARENHGEVTFTKVAEAEDYRKTLALEQEMAARTG